MRCRECGADLPDGVSFCRYCGSKVEPVKEKRFCPSCGASIVPGVKFCRNCGFNILHGKSVDDSDDIDEDESESEMKTKSEVIKKTGFEFWYNFDEITKAGIFGIGFFVYLLIIGIVARNTLAIVMGSIQIVLLICIGLIRYDKIKTDKKWIQYVLLAVLLIFSIMYVRSFYISQ